MAITTTQARRDESQRRLAGGRVGGKFYAVIEVVTFVAALNLLVLVMTLAGGVLFGIAPAYAAAVATTRAHLRGEGGSTVRLFCTTWRSGFFRQNAMQAPVLIAIVLLSVNLFAPVKDNALITSASLAALALALAYHSVLVTMDAHYDLSARRAMLQSGRFLVHAPGTVLLTSATLALVACLSWLLPGLIPVFSLGSAVYFCTALSLSFFAANDERISA